MKHQYKHRFIEDDLDPYVQKLNEKFKPINLKRNQIANIDWKFRFTKNLKPINISRKVNIKNNKISKKSMKTQKYIIKQLYELMPLRSRIKFHDRFGGNCLGDIYQMVKI